MTVPQASTAYFASLLIICITSQPGCNHRFPIPGEDGGAAPDTRHRPADLEILPEGLLLLPDGLFPDGMLPQACRGELHPLTLHADPRGNFTVAAQSVARARQITISKAQAMESAMAVDHGQVAAMALTRAPTSPGSTSVAELDALTQQLADDLKHNNVGTLSIRASGSLGKSHAGLAEVKEAQWHLTTNKDYDPSEIRNFVLASLLSREERELSGLPGVIASPTDSFVIKATLTDRRGQLAVSAAVAAQTAYDDRLQAVFIKVDDLGNGTALAAANTKTQFYCDMVPVTANAKADIVWVVDESGSMDDNRQDIVDHANTFFAKAKAAGLDFRMGITGVKAPTVGVEMGKFCSKDSQDKRDDGGEDRFLLPHEQTTFTSCINNPPYYEGGVEYGITNAYYAVKKHLPRQANSPTHIRPDAQLALIIATDEAPQELKPGGNFLGRGGFLSHADYKSPTCKLDPGKQLQLEQFLAPILNLLSGKADPEAKAMVHLIGGVCMNPCNADVAHGYRELASDRGGQFGDVCQKNLGATLQVMIDSIIGAASPGQLSFVPISSTLQVEAQGVALKRSRNQGYHYNAVSNTLSFNAVKVLPGHKLVISYRRFLHTK